MYSPQIDEEQVQALYKIKEAKNAEGEACSIASLVREIIGRFISEQPKDEKTYE